MGEPTTRIDGSAGDTTGSGELARRVAELDWAATPLGPAADWPADLAAAVRILLTSRFSMWMAWGPRLTVLYNDAYRRDTLRAKHPWALGRPADEVWAEIWPDIGPRIESVLETGQATWDEDLLLFLERAGYPEETYHTFSYSPLADGDRVAGMLCVVTENTDRVLSERRMATLRELAAALAPARAEAEVLAAVQDQLAANGHDLPFSLVYLFDEDAPRLVGACGAGPDDPITSTAGWPLEEVRAGRPEIVDDLGARFADLPTGAWSRPPHSAVLTPLPGAPGEDRVRGVLVVGLNPFRAFDERYRGFVDLLAGQIAAALVTARAYEAERRRAEALAELDRAKTEFFTGVSHEFRTPLTLIMGPIEQLLAAEQVDPNRWRAELDVAHRNGLRLGRLVNTLLDFSRLQAGRLQARFVPTSLATFTAELAGMFRAAVERAGLRLEVDIEEPGEPVWVDRDSWEKIVSNLLSNAVKFTFDGSIAVALRRVGATVALDVADTGIGVPAGELELLFDRFHQVRGARGRSAEGSGIGLALVRDLVELHGGTVSVTSRVGAGTTFTVAVPLGTAHLPAEQVSGQAPPPQDAGDATGSAVTRSAVAEALRWMEVPTVPIEPAQPAGQARPRLLVADDNADMREYLTRLLSPGYALQVVTDGSAALAAARERPPDLVITDVMMPDLDGFALIAALRAEPGTAGVPVIVLSARAGQDAVVEGLAAGADDYLVKPFSATELQARVRSTLALAGLRRREAAWRGALLSALQDGLFVVDGGGQVVQINDAFADLFGYGHDGLPYPRPHPWWPAPDVDPDGHAELTAALAEIYETGRGRHLTPMYHRDGHRLWVETSAATLPDPDRPDAPPMVIGVARDVTAAHRTARRDRLLSDVGQLLSTPEGLLRTPGRLQRVVDLAAPVLDDIVVVTRVGPDGYLHPLAAAHANRPELAAQMVALAPYRVPPSLLEAYRQGRAFALEPTPATVLGEALGDDYAARADLGLHAALLAPLAVQGRLVGLLIVGCPGDHSRRHPQAADHFDQFDVELADELARRLAVALEAERVTTREHHLNTAATALAAAGTVPEAAAALAAAVRDGLQASGIGIFVPQADHPSRLDLVHHDGLPAELPQRYAVVDIDHRSVVADAAFTGEPVWLGRPEQLGEYRIDESVFQAAAALPLRHAGRTVGVLGLAFGTPREFPADERGFAATLAAQAAQAFERAALADARARLADTLQRSLLPITPPPLDDLLLATRYLPGVAGVQAGGDWYDVLPLDAHRFAVVVGDVVGQGAPAAAVMGQLRSGLSAILTMLGPGADPAQALTRLNDYTARVPGARGSTAVCVVVDTDAAQIRWASAGHPPPLLLGHDGSSTVLDSTGPLLGAFPPGSPGLYRSAVRAFAPGDTVLLYTDGLVERRGEVIDDGIDRLADTARPLHHVDPDQLATTLLAELVPDGLGHDDIALVAARCLPQAQRASHPAIPEQLTRIRRDVDSWATATGLHPDHTDDLQLALGEALANAVEHAYRDTEPGEVGYTLRRTTDGAVQASVTDHGTWRPPPADRGYRGRGLQVIDALGRDVTVDHTGTGTTIGFTVAAPPLDAVTPTALPQPPLPEPATLHVDRGPAGVRLALHGGLDLATIAGLRERLLAEIDAADPAVPVVLDLHATTYLPSAGIGLVLELQERAGESGRPLTLDHDGTGPAARALALAGLTG